MLDVEDGPEIPLAGGDVTEGVVRIGGTVRRPHGPVSAAVERVLRHLEAQGFDGAPRWLGTDEQGRDALTFVGGEVAATLRRHEAWAESGVRGGGGGSPRARR